MTNTCSKSTTYTLDHYLLLIIITVLLFNADFEHVIVYIFAWNDFAAFFNGFVLRKENILLLPDLPTLKQSIQWHIKTTQ